ncbi:MAG: DEAD/DEAH box helicase [Acidimicrobiales bacterium]
MSITFASLGVPAQLRERLAQRGIVTPFPIQAATLPDALAGRDVCGRAPTGSGKTIAFGLALLARAPAGRPRRPSALVLAPTRELAAQIHTELASLAPDRARQIVAVYGGLGYQPQRKSLARGVTVVVGCPGRLEDLVAQGDLVLDDVEVVVIDEAGRMADMGFLPAVRRLLDRTRADRQTMLFSATLDGDVDALVRQYQRDPARHEVAGDDDAGDVTHVFWSADRAHRVGLTAGLVHQHGRVVVFCRTKHGADRVARQLTAAGVDAAAIHGNRSQGQRERALAAFSSGRISALVATDVAARGIHVDNVGCVVHFDPPGDLKAYVHRSGRTGRAGAAGTVVSLVSDDHRPAIRSLQRALGLAERVDQPDSALRRPTPQRPGRPGRPARPKRRPERRR